TYITGACIFSGVGKAALQRDLATLVADRQIIEKIYGKQKIYYVNQEILVTPTPSQLAEIDRECADLEALYKDRRQKIQELKAQLVSLNRQMSEEECLACIENIKRENEELHRQVQLLRANGSNDDHRSRRLQLEQLKQTVDKELRKRRKIAQNVIDQVLESGYPGTISQLAEEVGLELDPL
ncbi:homologous-pairing protein 2-like, partial [Tropilaelaps mercedesae]